MNGTLAEVGANSMAANDRQRPGSPASLSQAAAERPRRQPPPSYGYRLSPTTPVGEDDGPVSAVAAVAASTLEEEEEEELDVEEGWKVEGAFDPNPELRPRLIDKRAAPFDSWWPTRRPASGR